MNVRKPLLLCSLFFAVSGAMFGVSLCERSGLAAPGFKPFPKEAQAPLVAGKGGPLPRSDGSVEGVYSYVLPNGLKVLLVPEPSQPKVTVHIVYRVGSRHEGSGETGMAHLLEHMLFKGSSRHKDLLTEYTQHGVVFNAETNFDYTSYYQTMLATPENLRFALDLEADRMLTAKLDGGDLAKEFQVVRNELEIEENSPAAILEQRLLRVAYSWHGYGRDIIGSKSDIENVPIEKLRAFYRLYYQPDNAVLIVAGKLEREPTLRLISSLFGRIPRQPRKLMQTYTVEPVQDGERFVTLRRTGDVQIIGVVYHALPTAHPDFAAAQAAADVLTHEGSGRIYKALIEPRLATNLRAVTSPTAEPGTVAFFVDVPKGQPLQPVKDKLVATIEELGQKAIAPLEVRRFQARARKAFIRISADPEATAAELAQFVAAGDYRLRFLHRDRVEALTPEEVQSFAQRYFVAANRTLGLFLPTEQPQRSPQPVVPDVAALLKDYQGRPAPSPGENFVATVENIESRVQRMTLPSGMKVALLPKRSRGETVRLVLHVSAGTAKALHGKGELRSLFGPMLERGSKRRSFLQISDEFDRLNAEAQFPQLEILRAPLHRERIELTTNRAHLIEVLALLAELLQEPTFPKDQLEIVRKELTTEIEGALKEPSHVAATALFRKLFAYPADDPRHVSTLPGRLQRLSQVSVEELKQFHREYYGGGASQMAVVGDFDPTQVSRALETHFGAWRSPKAYERLIFPYVENAGAEETLPLPEKQNAVVLTGQALELSDQDPDYPALSLFGFLFGGSDNSRLSLKLREHSGTSYTVFSEVSAGTHDRSGMFFAFFTCAPQNARPGLALLERELSAILDTSPGPGKAPSAVELRAMQLAYKKAQETALADDRVLARRLATLLERDRTLRFDKESLERATALTPSEFIAAVRRHIAPPRLVKILAGDLEK
jgi:zinc protease